MSKRRFVLTLLTFLLASTTPFARGGSRLSERALAQAVQAPADAAPEPRPEDLLLGEWWTEGNEGRIRFIKATDGTFLGVTTCCKHDKPSPQHPERDTHNPDPKLRGRPTLGIIIIWKLRYEDGRYVDGYVYNPRDGATYRMKITPLDAEHLEIRGYLAIPLFGQTQVWKRAHLPDTGLLPAQR